MYAHQVIDSLKSMKLLDLKAKDKTLPLLNFYIDSIKSSQKFNLPRINHFSIRSFVKRFNLIEMEDFVQDFKLPYNCCWFDYAYWAEKPTTATAIEPGVATYIPSKRGMLLINRDNILTIHEFNYVGVKKRWEPSLYYILVDLTSGRVSGECIHEDIINFSSNELQQMVDADAADRAYVINAIQTLNCKNVGVELHSPPKKLNKKRLKKNKQPLFTYKTLILKPTGKKQLQQQSQGLWNNRVHLCRGHFKEYTQERPLFGSIVGRYWWQPSVRGNKKKGIIVKDYKINPTP